MRWTFISLALLALACGGKQPVDTTACGQGECDDGEACVHQAADLRGTCEAMPDTCDASDPCACDDLASLCDDATTFTCEIGTGGQPDMVCQ